MENSKKLLERFDKEGVSYFRYENEILAGPSERGMEITDFNLKANNVFPLDDYDYFPEFNRNKHLVGYRIRKSVNK